MVPVMAPLALSAPYKSLRAADSCLPSTFHSRRSPGAPKLPRRSIVFWPSASVAATLLMWAASASSLPLPDSGWLNRRLGRSAKSAATFHAGAMWPAAWTSALMSAAG